MWIVTVSVSVAEPEKEGVVSPDGDFGWFNVTVGGEVLTVKVAVLLFPGAFPIELGWTAIAVYCPFESGGPASMEAQLLPFPSAVALATMVPSAFVPL